MISSQHHLCLYANGVNPPTISSAGDQETFKELCVHPVHSQISENCMALKPPCAFPRPAHLELRIRFVVKTPTWVQKAQKEGHI